MLVFADALVLMDRSLWNYLRLTTWSPWIGRYLRERNNDPRSMLCAYFKSNLSVNGGWRSSSWGFVKILFFSDDSSIDGESLFFLSILNRYETIFRSKLSRWTILEPLLENETVYILPNWSGGGCWHFLQRWGIHLLHSIWHYFW